MPRTSSLPIIHAGLDEAGSLTGYTDLFSMAVVLASNPDALKNIIRRASSKSGKRLGRRRKQPAELKWRNASQRIRATVLNDLAESDVELFVLVVRKEGRRIADTPANYAILVCELSQLCWGVYPNMALAIDRHFTAPAQRAAVDTFVHRQWPEAGILTITHVDSQRNTLVQLADFVAGSAYDWHKRGDPVYRRLEVKVTAEVVESWRHIRRRWLTEK